MSNFYLSPRVGKGTYNDPYTFAGCETDSNRGGVFYGDKYLAYSDTPISDPRCVKLAESHDETLNNFQRKLIANAFGINEIPADKSLGETFFNLIRYPTITGLKPLRPSRARGQMELVVRGQIIHAEPYINPKWVNTFQQWQYIRDEYVCLRKEGYWHEGAWALAMASYTEDFSGSDTPPGGWTALSGTWAELGDGTLKVDHSSSNTDIYARFDSDLDSDDMEVSLDIVDQDNGGFDSRRYASGASARKDSTTTITHYYFGKRAGSTDEAECGRVSGGSFNLVGSRYSHTPSLPDTYFISCDGSTIIGKLDGTERVNETDTNITGNVRAGIYARSGDNQTNDPHNVLDNWSADDIATGGGVRNPLGHPLKGPFGGPIG